MPKSKHRKRPPTPVRVTPAHAPDVPAIQAAFEIAKRNPSAAESALLRAQEIIYDAWEAAKPPARIEKALKALRVSPLCADAYLLLAQACRDRTSKAEILRRGVRAGELALGPEFFEHEVGNSWGILETRGYMRARCELALQSWDMGDRDLAVEHYGELLRLNPNDNQGIRYLLADCYLALDRHDALADLFAAYPDDSGTEFAYARALMLFRLHGDTGESRAALTDACTTNGYAQLFLSTGVAMPRPEFDAITWGGMDEAISLAAGQGGEWRRTPGAREWLRTMGAAPAEEARRRFDERFGARR